MRKPNARILLWTIASAAVLLVVAAGVYANLRVIDGTHDDDRAGSLSPLLEPAGRPTRSTGGVVRSDDRAPARAPAARPAPRVSAPTPPRATPTPSAAPSGSHGGGSSASSTSGGHGSDDPPDVDDDHGGISGVDDGDGDDD